MQLSLIELWEATGPLARAVVVLLGGMSVVGGAVAVEKWQRLRRAERESEAFLAEWRRSGNASGGVRALAEHYAHSPVAALVGTVTEAGIPVAHPQRGELHDRIVRRFVLTTGAELRRGLSTIATVGSTAPFVGLFGTVIGIVNAFHEIGTSGRGGITAVSTGIAEALVTTAFGIMVAIPAVWLFNTLSQRVARLLVTVEATGEELAVASVRADDVAGECGR